jgi:ABC-type multidrug transport system fused ATPase/permease subunit
MKNLIKLNKLLTIDQKKKTFYLSLFILLGIFFEMSGIGILIPIMTIVLKNSESFSNKYINNTYLLLGKPKHSTLILYSMFFIIIFFTLKYFYLLYLNKKQAFFSTSLSSDFSKKLFNGYMNMPYTFHLIRNSSILLRNIQVEVYQITTVTQAYISLFMEISVILGLFVMLIIIEPLGALTVAFFLFLSSFLFHQKNKKKLFNWGLERKIASSGMNKFILEGLGGVKDIKFLGRESYFVSRYEQHNNQYSIINANVIYLSQIPRIFLEFLSIYGLVLMILLQIFRSRPTEDLIPILSMFLAASFRLIPSINKIMASIQSIKFTKPVVDGIIEEFKIIDSKKSIVKNETLKISTLNFENNIEIKNLSFQYESTSKFILKNINLNIKKGSAIGFIGSSGSGKSTLIDIILGILTPSEGNIFIDKIDVNENLRLWQNLLGYVPQSIFLSDESIRNNIAFGIEEKLINEEQIQEAIQMADLQDFINSLPKGIETVVGERGVRLSGGQRQRIGIARALYYNPQIIIFDEATSALDASTEDNVMDSINKLKNIKTMIIVAHRLSTLSKCDIIYELSDGTVIKSLTSGELFKK